MKILKFKSFGFVLQDYVKKTSILPVYQELLSSQYWNDEQIYIYRLKKLQNLIQYAYSKVPYYSELFDKIDLSPDDIKSLEDIRKIPILTKELARANQSKLIAKKTNYKYVKKGKTGGTTGVPLIIYKDTIDRSFAHASKYRWYNWMGLGKEDKVLSLWGSQTVLRSSLRIKLVNTFIEWIQNNKTINTFNINNNNLHEIYSQIMKYDPVLIKGYLSAIILVAKHMQANALPPNKNLKAISSTTETLLPMYRTLIQEVFSVPVYDQYGCGENSAISFECKQHNGLHINEEHVIVECLDENNNNLLEKKGRLIITSLDNLVMPFIRYENGDMATLHKEKCNCEVNSQLMSSIEGRTTDTIVLNNGSHVHGVFFTDILYEIGITTELINRFQIYQYKTGNIDFILETNREVPGYILDNLKKETLRFVNSVNIKIVSFIPNEVNGKYKYIKCENNGD